MQNTKGENIYPAHLYEAERREIAIRYIRHELRKLFPNVRDEEMWKLLDSEVAGWWNENPTLAPVRDFWNGLHGISMGFKLKNVVSWVTSAHLKWGEKEVSVDELWFGSPIGFLKGIHAQPSAREVREWIFQPERAEQLEEERARSRKEEDSTMPRNAFPIIAIRKGKNLIVTDGNRRLLRAILTNQERIYAVTAEPIGEPLVFDAWVPTASLCELVSFHRYWSSLKRDTTEHVAHIIAELIRDSSAGRIEFMQRAVSESEIDTRLIDIVRSILKKDGIDL
jgi:hypothetical protein